MHEDRLAQIDEVINNGIYKDTWESIAAYPVPEWKHDGKCMKLKPTSLLHKTCLCVSILRSTYGKQAD